MRPSASPGTANRRRCSSFNRGRLLPSSSRKTRIRAILLQEERNWPAGQRGWSQSQRAELRKLVRPLVECEATQLWRGILGIELRHLEQTEALVIEAEAKLDGLVATDARTVLPTTFSTTGASGSMMRVGVRQRERELLLSPNRPLTSAPASRLRRLDADRGLEHKARLRHLGDLPGATPALVRRL